MTVEEYEAFWRDLGRPAERSPEDRRVLQDLGFLPDDGPADLSREQWEYLVQRRMARADIHGGEL